VLEHGSLAVLHEGTDGRGSCVELGDPIFVNDTPVPIVSREEWGALKLEEVLKTISHKSIHCLI